MALAPLGAFQPSSASAQAQGMPASMHPAAGAGVLPHAAGDFPGWAAHMAAPPVPPPLALGQVRQRREQEDGCKLL